MISIVLGVFTLVLGFKGFSSSGLPLTRHRKLTGTSARLIGCGCLLLGTAFLLYGIVETVGMF